jgi:hypothetical protein
VVEAPVILSRRGGEGSVGLWIAAGLLSFWACTRLGIHATSIDLALPWIALIVTFIAWLGESTAVLCAVPLLIGCAISFSDDRTRLLGYGAIVAVAFCGAMLNAGAQCAVRGAQNGIGALPNAHGALSFPRAAGFAIAGTALIRWIAREHFQFFREAILLALVIAIVAVAKHAPIGIALALLAALYTPAIPFRTLAIPIAFLIPALLEGRTPSSAQPRDSAASPRGGRGRPPLLEALSTLVIAIVVTLFPYSGIVARTPRYLRYGKPATNRVNLYWALKPGQSHDFEVPTETHALILSLSHGENLRGMTVVGRLGDRELHAGDLADWGFARRDQWWRAKNRLPRHAAGLIRGYGYDGWVDGAVRVEIPRDAKTIRVSVDPHLPPPGLLQVEAFER